MLGTTTYTAVLSLHIMAALVAYGLPLTAPVLLPWLRKHHPETLPGVHAAQHRLNVVVTGPFTVLLLLFGTYLAADRDLWGEPFVHFGIAAVLIIAVAGGWIVKATKRLSELAAAGGEEYEALFRRYLAVETGLGLVVLLAVYFMAAKPFT